MGMQGGRLYEFGPFLLDAAERKLSRRGKPVALPHKAFDVLLVLVRNRGRMVEKDALMREVWQDSFVEEANLSVNIAKLRRALHDDAREPGFIETVPKHGYRFIAKVRCPSGGEAEGLTMAMPRARLEPTGGAVPLPSKFYIERPADAEFRSAIAGQHSIVLIQGPRQVGKTSL
ncbi:MAG TPA: winged helix-turn-helix domain-containing protein, partial [Pyrinomonadaceae bacterium]|nr:winged helix-turn-helix domain-containing protein [Pyrinomonadaceae bacterium]